MALRSTSREQRFLQPSCFTSGSTAYLESTSGLHLVPEHGSDVLIEALHHAHSELRLDPATADQLIEGVGEGLADAVSCVSRRRAALGEAASVRGVPVELVEALVRGRHLGGCERELFEMALSATCFW